MPPELIPAVVTALSGVSKSGYLILGAAMALLFMHYRDYRLDETASKKSFKWYIFYSNTKKFDETLMTLFAIIMAEGFMDTLSGLDTNQLITTGIGLGIAVKRKVN